MADEGLSMEARLKDYISSNLKTIEDNLRGFTDVSRRELLKQTEQNNQLSRSVNQVKGSWDLLGIATKQIIGIVGGLAIYSKITGYLKECSTEIRSQIDAEAQLESALGYTSKALLDNATLIQSRTTFADDEIIQAQALIGSFIKEEDSIKAVTRAAVDFAAAKRMDVTSAADLFTKSIITGTNALSRYGIMVKDTNIVEDRMASLIKNVNKTYDGRAEALAKTDSGKIKQANNLIGDQQELIGVELLPVMREWYSLQLKMSELSVGPLSAGLRSVNNWIQLIKGSTWDAIAAQNLLKDAQKDTSKEMKEKLLTTYEEYKNKLTDVNEKIKELSNPNRGGILREGSFLDKFFSGDLEKYKKKAEELKSLIASLAPLVVQDQKIVEGDDKENERQKQILSATERFESSKIKLSETGYNQQLALAKVSHQKELADLQTNREAQNILRQAQINELEIMERDHRIQLNAYQMEMDAQERQIDVDKENEKFEIAKRYGDRYVQLADEINQQTLSGRIETVKQQMIDELTLWEYYTDTGLISQQQYENMKTLLVKQESQKRIQDYVNEATQLASAFSSMLGAWQGYLSTKRNTEYQNEVERIKGLKLSKKQEEKMLKDAEEANKKAAKKEQGLAVAVALINGAVAITKAYATAGNPWLGTAYAIIIAACTAFQVATIKSQKLARGGTVNTFLGEQGMEYAAGYGIVNAPSYHQLPVGTHVYNNTDTKNMLGNNTIVIQIPPGTHVDSRVADRIEDTARWIGESLVIAKREGRLVNFETMR